MDAVDRAEMVREARQQATSHFLLALVGAGVAAWVWQDPWGPLGPGAVSCAMCGEPAPVL